MKVSTISDTARILKSLVETSLDNDKAQDVTVIDLAGKSDMADYMIVATGTSARHVGAMAKHIAEKLMFFGEEGRLEGMEDCDWVLIDNAHVIVHIFRPEIRAQYQLEKMWTADFSESEVAYV